MPDDGDEDAGGSSPCLLHALGPDGTYVDRRQAQNVALWRKAERERLIEIRLGLPAQLREPYTTAITSELDRIIKVRPGEIVSVYWQMRAEPD